MILFPAPILAGYKFSKLLVLPVPGTYNSTRGPKVDYCTRPKIRHFFYIFLFNEIGGSKVFVYSFKLRASAPELKLERIKCIALVVIIFEFYLSEAQQITL